MTEFQVQGVFCRHWRRASSSPPHLQRGRQVVLKSGQSTPCLHWQRKSGLASTLSSWHPVCTCRKWFPQWSRQEHRIKCVKCEKEAYQGNTSHKTCLSSSSLFGEFTWVPRDGRRQRHTPLSTPQSSTQGQGGSSDTPTHIKWISALAQKRKSVLFPKLKEPTDDMTDGCKTFHSSQPKNRRKKTVKG